MTRVEWGGMLILCVVGLPGQFGDAGDRRHSPVGAMAQAPAVVPFRLASGFLVVVEGSIGSLDRLRFVIDTGSSRSLIHDGIAHTLGLRGTVTDMYAFGERIEAEEVVAPSVAFGPIRAAELPVLTEDLRPQEQRFGFRPDALVGMDVLRDRCFGIDYAAETVTFECVREWPATAALDTRLPYPVVEASIDDARYRLIVDSGSEAIVIFERAIPDGKSIKVDAEVEALHLTGTQRVKRFTPSRFRVGEHAIGSPPVFIMSSAEDTPGFDGVLGTRWLPGTEVYVDFGRRVVGWR